MTTASWAKRPHALIGLRGLLGRLVGEDLEHVAVVLLQGAGAGLGLGLLAGQPAAPRRRAAGAVADRAGQADPLAAAPPGRVTSMTVQPPASAPGSYAVPSTSGTGQLAARAGLVVLDQPVAVLGAHHQGAVGPLGGLADDLAGAVVHVGLAGDRDGLVAEPGGQGEQVAGRGLQRREQVGRSAGARTGGGTGRRGAEHPRGARARGEEAGSGDSAAAEEVASTEGAWDDRLQCGDGGRAQTPPPPQTAPVNAAGTPNDGLAESGGNRCDGVGRGVTPGTASSRDGRVQARWRSGTAGVRGRRRSGRPALRRCRDAVSHPSCQGGGGRLAVVLVPSTAPSTRRWTSTPVDVDPGGSACERGGPCAACRLAPE